MKVKDLVARMKLRRMKNRTESGTLTFPGALQSPKHLLLCLPSGLRELSMVKQLLPKVQEMFKPADICLLSCPGVRVADIFPRKGFQILTPGIDQVTWAGLPKQSYLDMLAEYKFDMLIDFNLEQSFFMSTVLLHFPKAVRIGRGNQLGCPFYNLEIKTKYLRDERAIYRSLLETINSLRTGRYDRPTPGGGIPSLEEPCI